MSANNGPDEPPREPQRPALLLRQAGALVRIAGELAFLPSAAVRGFVPAPPLSEVSGSGLTMALVDGQVLAVVAIAAPGAALAVCELGGELVGLLGMIPETAGFFETDGSCVLYQGRPVPVLDVSELVRAAVLGKDERKEVES